MANLYELKFENYGVCLNIEISSIEKNAFLCEQIDENQYKNIIFLNNKLILKRFRNKYFENKRFEFRGKESRIRKYKFYYWILCRSLHYHNAK